MASVYGISDLHLSLGSDKPMDIFGPQWRDHAGRMAEAWDATVAVDDVVLCPGDISWAMRLGDARLDLGWLGQRPGTKVLCRGNHDYWWSSISKVRAALPPGCVALQNDAVDLGAFVVAGSRLWGLPEDVAGDTDDARICRREAERLARSLQVGRDLAGSSRPLIVMTHYPPFGNDGAATVFSDLIERAGAVLCVYGHLHGDAAHATAVEGAIRGVTYALVASDFLAFRPRLLSPFLDQRRP